MKESGRKDACHEASERKVEVDVVTDGVWCLPLKILLATAPQGAMGRPFWSLVNGSQYELGFWSGNKVNGEH